MKETIVLSLVFLAPGGAAQSTQSELAKPPGASLSRAAPDKQAKSGEKWASAARALAAQARMTYQDGYYTAQQPLWKKALEAAEAGARAEPRQRGVLKLRAQLYTEVRAWNKAEEAWRAYASAGADPGSAPDSAAMAQYNLGYAAYIRRNPSEAASYFDHCLQLDPLNVLCNSWAGRVALEAGQYNQAEKYYAQALQESPDDRTLLYFAQLVKKADLYGSAATAIFIQAYGDLEAGRTNQALDKFQQAARAAGNFTEAWRESGHLAFELGQAQAALEAYQGAAALPGADKRDKVNLTLAQEGVRYGVPAVRAFRAAYHQYLAGNKPEALTGFTKATVQNSKYAKAWAWVGRLQYGAKNFPAAAQAYSQAVSLNPEDKISAYYLRLARQHKSGGE